MIYTSYTSNNNLAVTLYYRELEKAAEAAFQDRNSAALDQVLAKCGHRREITDKVQMLKSQLGAR